MHRNNIEIAKQASYAECYEQNQKKVDFLNFIEKATWALVPILPLSSLFFTNKWYFFLIGSIVLAAVWRPIETRILRKIYDNYMNEKLKKIASNQ